LSFVRKKPGTAEYYEEGEKEETRSERNALPLLAGEWLVVGG
jgi:hypothetical protein